MKHRAVPCPFLQAWFVKHVVITGHWDNFSRTCFLYQSYQRYLSEVEDNKSPPCYRRFSGQIARLLAAKYFPVNTVLDNYRGWRGVRIVPNDHLQSCQQNEIACEAGSRTNGFVSQQHIVSAAGSLTNVGNSGEGAVRDGHQNSALEVNTDRNRHEMPGGTTQQARNYNAHVGQYVRRRTELLSAGGSFPCTLLDLGEFNTAPQVGRFVTNDGLAARAIEQNTVVSEILGERISTAEADRREEDCYRIMSPKMINYKDQHGVVVIDTLSVPDNAVSKIHFGRKNANLKIVVYFQNAAEAGRPFAVSTRRIEKGEILILDTLFQHDVFSVNHDAEIASL